MVDAGAECVYVTDSAGALVLSEAQARVAALVAEVGRQAEVGFHDLGVPAQPLFIARGGFSDVHGLPR